MDTIGRRREPADEPQPNEGPRDDGPQGAVAALPREPEPLVATALASLGFGAFQRRAFALGSIGWSVGGLYCTGVPLLLPQLEASFGASRATQGLFLLCFYLGFALGELLTGELAGSKGRVPSFIGTLWAMPVAAALTAVSPWFPLACIFALALGGGIGGMTNVAASLFLEWVPKSKASLMSYMNLVYYVVCLVPSILAFLLLPLDITIYGPPGSGAWRAYLLALAGIGALSAAATHIFVRPLLETPHFLASKGRLAEAAYVLRRAAGINGRDADGVAEITQLEMLAADKAAKAGKPDGSFSSKLASLPSKAAAAWRSLVSFFREAGAASLAGGPQFRRNGTLLYFFWTLYFFGTTMFSGFVAVIMQDLGLTDVRGTYRDLIIYTLFAAPSTIAAKYMLDSPRLGRVGTLWTTTLFAALSLGAFSAVCVLAARTPSSALQIGAVVASTCFNAGAQASGAALWLYTPELFAPGVRTEVVALYMGVGRAAATVAPAIAGVLLRVPIAGSTALLPLVAGVLLAVSAVLARFMPVETLPGKRDRAGKVHPEDAAGSKG
ncbi:major facilitator superfamily domain-containing protein [Hyaloraphidium curvatum]|nr:major facilitator superfamily domain-containing protein [Hyaloraphidium curvatum]